MPQFDRDLKRLAKKKGDRIGALHADIRSLRNHEPLPRNRRNHALKGKWAGFLECHVGGEGDWLLLYIIIPGDPGMLTLVRTGTHDEIFE